MEIEIIAIVCASVFAASALVHFLIPIKDGWEIVTVGGDYWVARKKVNGAWQYRAMTDEEHEDAISFWAIK